MKLNIALFVTAAIITGASVTASAQLGGRPNQPGNRPAPPKSYFAEYRMAADNLGAKFKVKILVEPGIFVAAPPKYKDPITSLDQGLDVLTPQARGAAWRRVYVKDSTTTPSAEKLANTVRAIEAMDQSGIVLENPTLAKAATVFKDNPVGPTFKDELAELKFNAVPVYIIFAKNAADSAKTMEEKFADLQRQQMEMMQNMTPDQMASAMQSGMMSSMQMFGNMDPAQRQQMMGTMMKSGMQMFMNMPADQRNGLIQSMGQMFGPGGPGGIGGGRPGGPGRP